MGRDLSASPFQETEILPSLYTCLDDLGVRNPHQGIDVSSKIGLFMAKIGHVWREPNREHHLRTTLGASIISFVGRSILSYNPAGVGNMRTSFCSSNSPTEGGSNGTETI